MANPKFRWDVLWWDIKNAFRRELALFKSIPGYKATSLEVEIFESWTWRGEFQNRWEGIKFNVGTKEHPEWVMMK